MACGAAASCLLVILKLWKLLSVGAVVTLLFKRSDIADLLSHALNPSGFDTSPPWEPDSDQPAFDELTGQR